MSKKSMPSVAAPVAHLPDSPGTMHPPRGLAAPTRNVATGDPAQVPAAIASDGGALVFELKAADSGGHVMRIHRRDDGAKVSCSVLFDDEPAFLDWIDADPLRFTHALVFQQVRRCFAQLVAQQKTCVDVRS